MPKVYVVNKSGHDFSKAKRFGELIYLSEGAMSKFATNKMYRIFVNFLQFSKPDDLLLLTGYSTMNSVASAIFAHMHGKVNYLIYDDRGSYAKRTLKLSALLEDDLDDT